MSYSFFKAIITGAGTGTALGFVGGSIGAIVTKEAELILIGMLGGLFTGVVGGLLFDLCCTKQEEPIIIEHALSLSLN